MADGSRKPIEDIKLGEQVLATDPETGETGARQVDRLITGTGIKHLVTISIDTDGLTGDQTASVTATDGHPFWSPELHLWIDAAALQPGQYLRTAAGTWVQIAAITHYAQVQRVHNLTIHDTHTYYVVAGTTAALSHNCGDRESTWTPDENYSPEEVDKRSADNRAFYETPQDIHDLVDAIVANPNYPQRMTGPSDNRKLDFYGASGAPRSAQRWKGAAIYDNGDSPVKRGSSFTVAETLLMLEGGEMAHTTTSKLSPIRGRKGDRIFIIEGRGKWIK